MGFYKSLLIGTIASLIIVLAIMGVILANQNKTIVYPPEINNCPDYYTVSASNNCVLNSTIYSTVDPTCSNKNFSENIYNANGTGPLSGLCEKKKWANNCGVTWDGITNNPDICYTTS